MSIKKVKMMVLMITAASIIVMAYLLKAVLYQDLF